ncbi:MAG: hypothetical protein AAB585_02655 [Patescibacteria group bacterium]
MLTNELGRYFNASPYFAGLSKDGPEATAEFYRRFGGLTLVIKQLLVAGETAEFLYQLAEKHQLYDFEVAELGRLVRHIVIGKVQAAAAINIIVLVLKTNQTKAATIFNEIAISLLHKVGVVTGPPSTVFYPGQDLPETGGNIIDLRGQK